MSKVWNVAANLTIGRCRTSGFGVASAGAIFGGEIDWNVETNSTEEFDGSTWSNGGSLAASFNYAAGFGNLAAGVSAGGSTNDDVPRSQVYGYDGSSWSSKTSLNVAKAHVGGAGLSTAGMAFGGYIQTGSYHYSQTSTEEYDGSSWTTVNSMNQARSGFAGFGTQTSALCAGGEYIADSKKQGAGDKLASVEQYDGTTWTSNGFLVSAKRFIGGVGASGISGVVFCDESANTFDIWGGYSQEYDGVSWSFGGRMLILSLELGGFGTKFDAMAVGNWSYYPETQRYTYATDIDEQLGSWEMMTALLSGDRGYGTRYHNTTGTTSAGLSFGGGLWDEFNHTQSDQFTAKCDEWSGSAWSTSGSLTGGARQQLGGAGTQTATVAIGGYRWTTTHEYMTVSEEYNGATWSDLDNLLVARAQVAGVGTMTAALAICGRDGTNYKDTTETYNGSAWSSGDTLSAGTRGGMQASGSSSTSAIAFLGARTTEEYDGVSWSSISNLYINGDSGCGNSTTAAWAGSGYSRYPISNFFDGTTWFVAAPPPYFLYATSAMGNASDFMLTGGIWASPSSNYTFFNTCQRYTKNAYTPFAGVWSLIDIGFSYQRYRHGAIGSEFAFVIFGGESNSSNVDATSREFTGVGWTAGGNLNTHRANIGGFGTMTAGISAGGYTAVDFINVSVVCESYDGTSWTNINSLNTARQGGATLGSSNSTGLYVGGRLASSDSATVESFNGTNWSNETSLNVAKGMTAGAGSESSAIIFGGSTGGEGGTKLNVTEEYNGTTWSASGNLITARTSLGGSGTQGSALSYGGNTGYSSGSTEAYDGNAWQSQGSMIGPRYYVRGVGDSSSNAMAFGGYCGVYPPWTSDALPFYGAISGSLQIFEGPYISFQLDGWQDGTHVDLYWK